MVGIISGSELGLQNSSLALLGANAGAGGVASGRANEITYVNAATGNLVLQNQDDVLISKGLDVNLVRTYNSRGATDGDNNDGWRIGVYKKVYQLSGTVNTSGSTITRVAGDGSEIVYTYDSGSGMYRTTNGNGAHDTLSFSSNIWTWTDGTSRITESYDHSNGGRITQIIDSDGNATTYTYNGSGLITQVSSASGETTYLDYSGTNLTQIRVVKSSTQSDGLTVTLTQYQYDGSNRLWKVITDLSPENNSISDNDTYVTTYSYDGTSKRITQIAQTDGTSLSVTYESDGAGDYRVKTITDGLSRTTTLTYSTTPGQVDVQDPTGATTSYFYDSQKRLTKISSPSVNSQILDREFAYDGSGNVTSVTQRAQGGSAISQVVYEYDSNGNETLQRDLAGNTISRTYDSSNQLLSETVYVVPDPDGAGSSQPGTPHTKRYVYDAESHLRFVISAEGRVTEHQYDAAGNRSSTIQYTGDIYTTAGTPTEANLTNWLSGVTKSNSMRTDMVYDFRGSLSRVTTYTAVLSTGVGVVDGSEAKTDYVYDQAGRLLKTIDARGVATTGVSNDFETVFVYDGLNRVISTTNALGKTTLTDFDDANNKTVITVANGSTSNWLVTTSTYNAAGELTSFKQSDGSQTLGETLYFYDDSGRLRRTVDPTGISVHFLYDAAGRKVAEADGDGSLTEFIYDANNQITKTIRYANAVAPATLSTLIDGNGQPTTAALSSIRPSTSSNDRSAWNIYDAAGRLIKTVDSLGYVTATTYDGVGRIVSVVQHANAISNVTTLLDAPATGDVNPTASSTADRRIRNFYDTDGMLRGSLNAENFLTEYIYDKSGQLVETVGYATQKSGVNWDTDSLDTLRPTVNSADIHSYHLYNARGQLNGVVDGAGYLTEFVFDLAGNQIQQIRYGTAVTYTSGATIASLRPNGTPSSTLDQWSVRTYTALNQMASETRHPDGTTTEFVYDDVGNLIKTTLAASTSDVRVLNAQYDRLGRLTGELTGVGSSLLNGNATNDASVWSQYGVLHTYDAAGRRKSTTDANSNKTLFYYNPEGALTHTINALGEVREVKYNTFGQVSETIQYGTRIAAGTLSGLAGGMVDTTLQNAVAAITNASLDSRHTVTYYKTGAINVAQDALGYQTTSSYNAFRDLVQTTQQLGSLGNLVRDYAYDRRGLLTSTASDAAGINTTETVLYDAFGRAKRITDSYGNYTENSYDKRGRIVVVSDSLSRSTTTSFDAFDRVLTQVDARGNQTSYSYNTASRSVTVTTPDSVTMTTVKNRNGEVVSVTDRNGYVTTYTYDKNGNSLTTQTPAGTSQSVYDRANRIVESYDERGIKTVYQYDVANRMLSRTVDAVSGGLNLVTSFSFDAKGQTVSTTNANGVVTQTTYDLNGRSVTTLVDPSGLAIKTTYAYDGRGKTLTVTEAADTSSARTTQYVYDKRGRLTQQIVDPGSGKLNLTTTFAYDKNDNVLSKLDANGNVTRYVYDGASRLVFTIDPLGNVSRTYYDANNNVTKTVAYATAITISGSPSVAAVESAISATTYDRTARTYYDTQNRVRFVIDAERYINETRYDNAGHITQTLRYAQQIDVSTEPTYASMVSTVAGYGTTTTRINAFTYDGAGRLTQSTDELGYTESYTYDNAGNKLTFTNKKGAAWSYQYDAAGRLLQEQGPGVQVVSSAGVVESSVQLITRMQYDALGNVVSRTEAYGRTEARTTQYLYDAAGRQFKTIYPQVNVYNSALDNLITNGAGSAVNRSGTETASSLYTQVTYDAIGNAVVNRAADGVYSYKVYDANRRLRYEIDGESYVTEYQYDVAGNQTVTVRYANRIDLTGHTAGTAWALSTVQSKLAAQSDHSKDRRIDQTFDLNNRLTEVIEPQAYIYDATSNTSATAARRTVNIYDAFGQVVQQRTTTGLESGGSQTWANTYFHYNRRGELKAKIDNERYLTEWTYDAAGNRISQIEYADKVPAQAESLRISYTTPSSSNAANVGHNRTTTFAYDLANRKISETKVGVHYNGLSGNTGTTDITGNVTTQFGYDAVGNLIRVTDVGNNSTYTYYDALGRVYAIASPTRLTADTGYGGTNVTPLTVLALDAFGQAVFQANYANGAATASTSGYTLGASSANDQVIINYYDSHGRLIQKTDANGASSYYSYDAAGRVAKSWQGLNEYWPSSSLTLINQIRTYQYDKLGNQLAMVDSSNRPAFYDSLYPLPSNVATSLGSTINQSASYSQTPDGEGGYTDNWQPNNSLSLSWGINLATLGSGAVTLGVYYTYASGGSGSMSVNVGGGVTTGTTLTWSNSHWTSPYGISSVQRILIYKQDVSGNWGLIHDTNTHGGSSTLVSIAKPSSGAAVSVQYRANAGSSWASATQYDFGNRVVADLRSVGSVEYAMHYSLGGAPSSAYAHGNAAGGAVGAATMFSEERAVYNAFGEIVSKQLNGSETAYFDYDNAGNLWRTNQNGGANTVYLYDAQGRATAEIRSNASNLKTAYASASAVDLATRAPGAAVRTETQYDHLGRTLIQELPALGSSNASLVRAPMVQGTSVTSNIVNQGYWENDESGQVWVNNGSYISLGWTSLAGWGGGNVRVDVDVVGTTSGAFTISQWVGAGATQGATIHPSDHIASITRVRVYKQDINSNAVLVRDSSAQNPYKLKLFSPTTNQNGDYAEFSYKLTGSSTWSALTVSDFGAISQFDVSALSNATYDYQVVYKHSNGTQYASGTGTMVIGGGNVTITPSSGSTNLVAAQAMQTVDRWGNVLTSLDPRFSTDATPTLDEWQTDYRYNEWGLLISQTSPQIGVHGATSAAPTTQRVVTRNFYDNLGRTIGAQDANSVLADTNNNGVYDGVNTLRYNAAGQVIREYRTDGGVVNHNYDTLGRKVGTWDARGIYVGNTYDKLDRLTQVTYGSGDYEQYEYDAAGNRIRERNANGNWTTYAYDTRGNMIRKVLPNGQTTTTYYDLQGRKSYEVDANSQPQYWWYDQYGRTTAYYDLAGYTHTTVHNNLGSAASVTVSNGSTTRSTITYTYETNGALKTIGDTALAGTGSGTVTQSTEYQYDAAGNRVRETFTRTGTVYEDAVLTYDALNRVVDVNDTRYHLIYTYDANGNRRRTQASLYNNSGGYTTKDYWYAYDSQNRIVLSQGVWNGSTIVVGSQGTTLSYDAAGNRATANGASTAGAAESYVYDSKGRLTQIHRNSVMTHLRSLDNVGNAVQVNTYDAGGTLQNYTVNSYTTNGWLSQAVTYKRVSLTDGGGNYYATYGLSTNVVNTGFKGTGQISSYQVHAYNPHYQDHGYWQTVEVGESGEAGYYTYNVWNANTIYYASYQYSNYYSTSYAAYGGAYKESTVSGTSTYFAAGSNTTRYDGNGNLHDITDQFGGANYRSFITDQAGRILQKMQGGQNEYYFYANDKPLGSTGIGGVADFDFNYTPVSDKYPATTPGSYVVAQGDTLRSIAAAMFGDAGLWYLVADANGISSDSQLVIGRSLTIPNKISNLHNNYQTFKPYAPGEIIGDTTPTLPDPPPPPPASGGGGCGGIGQIIVIVVAVVATILTMGAAATVAGGAVAGASTAGGLAGAWSAGVGILGGATITGGSIGAFAAGVIGGAVGSIASQVVGMAIGAQDKFSWSGVAVSALSTGFAAGTAGGEVGKALGVASPGGKLVAGAIANNVVTQGLNIVTGQQQKFNWKGVAASAIAAPVARAVGGADVFKGSEFGQFAGQFASGLTSGVIRQAIGGRVDFVNVAADAFGNALGQALSPSSGAGAQQVNARSEWQDSTYAQNSVTGTMTDAPLRDAGPGAYIGDVYHESRYDAADQIHVLQPTVVSASRDTGLTAADIEDAEFGGNYGDSPYAMDEARTRFQLDEGARTAQIVNGQIAEAKAMADARAAQKATTVNNDFEIDPRDGMRAGPTVERALARGIYMPDVAAGGLFVSNAGGAAVGYLPGGRTASGDRSGTVMDGTGWLHLAADNAKDAYKLSFAAYAARQGFVVNENTGKAFIYGSHAANRALDLPENFRTSSIDNERLLAAKGFNPNVITAIAEDLKPWKLGGALVIGGAAIEGGSAYYQFSKSEGTFADKAILAGALGNTGVKTIATTGATAGLITGGMYIASTIGVGTTAIATAPVLITVGAAVAIGSGVTLLYDKVAGDSVKSFFKGLYSTHVNR